MKSKRMVLFISIAVLSIATAVTFTFWYLGRNNLEMDRVSVYYFNASNGKIEKEDRVFPAGNQGYTLESVINFMQAPPRNTHLSNTWPSFEAFLLNYNLNGNALEVLFSSRYHEMPPVEEALFRAAFTLSLTELPFIDYVLIRTEGGSPMEENRESIQYDTPISPFNSATRTFTLYFISETAENLLPESHTNTDIDRNQIERYIVSRIIAGSEMEGRLSLVPPETKIHDVHVEGNGCFINLSGEFVSRFNQSAAVTQLMLYSFVNSLTVNERYIRRVYFLINGEKLESLNGIYDLHLGLEKDESLIAGFGEQ